MKPDECIAILKLTCGGGLEGAVVKGMLGTLNTSLCNESHLVLAYARVQTCV